MENHIEILQPATRAIERRQPEVLTLKAEPEPPVNLLSYWVVLRKRRWTVLAILAVIFTVDLIATVKEKPLYESKALIEIERENPNIPTAEDLFEIDNVSNTFLETQYKVLESESVLRRVVRDLRLDELPEFNPPKHWWSLPSLNASSVAGTQDPSAPQPDSLAVHNALKTLDDRLSVEPVKQSRLVEVSFESENPILAAEIVNGIASNYVDQNLELRWDAAQKASEWLSQQLVGVKAKLEKSENEMQAYARANGLLFLENEKGTTENIVDSRLRQLQAELTKAQADRFEKESLFRLIEAGDYGALPTVFENHEIQELTLRLSDLETQRAQLATTFAPDFPKLKQVQSEIDEAQGMLDAERNRAATRIRDDYTAAVSRETLLKETFADARQQADQIAEKSVQYGILKREVDTNHELYDGLLERLKQAGISAGLKESNVRIVDPAVPSRRPSKPRVALNLGLGLFLGLSVGIGAALLQEHFDNSLKTTEEVERILHLPALAMIPSVESLNGRGNHAGASNGDRTLNGVRPAIAAAGAAASKANGNGGPLPHWYLIDDLAPKYSALTEAFRSLRTSVLLSAADCPPRSLLVSSAQPGEGKTTVSTNLAISLAQLGQRVLLVDGDLRRPSVHRAFGIRDSLGVVSYLTGQQDWRAAVEKISIANLDVLVSGPIPPNPAELLSSDRMKKLVAEALTEYKFVVIDSPPLLNVADSRILATLVEGVVLVIKGGETSRELARRAQMYASDVGARVIGVVLNNIDLHREEYSYYYQHYHYDAYEAQPSDTAS
ncbi:MAG TPA: polysaccharide biosynthesis tyrosine autokinase [Candidatus Limnocylindrales bacterium]|nr:polysaccharide biosynthesis tyrosine autokinase [Candidatus Limnocylindrales bacterium]